MKKFGLLLFIFLFLSCQKQEKPTISFYYWKTIFKLSESEKAILKNNQVQKLYVRYFDIDLLEKTNEAFPKAPIQFQEKIKGFKVVPVIYIKNKVFLNSKINIEELAAKTNSFINQINTKNNIAINEVQFDCDWTLTSKDAFFKFIEIFKKAAKIKISATIRLHQIKYYQKTGVPNVDKAVLMYYNMGKIAPDSLNSIYDKKIADKYLESIQKYPLQLEIALPIYSWAIHIRDGKITSLKSKISIENIKKDTNFVQVNNRFFKAKNPCFKGGTYYKTDDILKFESISEEDLLEMTDDLKENLKQSPNEIIFYDLDEFNTQQYENDIFTKISNRF